MRLGDNERQSGALSVRPAVAVYYFPNYHADDRNAAVHGAGWTEWELVKAARARWKGHGQPKKPLWGYADEADPKQMARKIDAAADHGIDAFVFDWYFYDDGPFLQRALDEGFLGAKNNRRLKFALMWANHDWIDIHPAKRGVKHPLHFPGKVSPAGWERLTDVVVARYFSHPSYWRLDGAPYFSIYELSTFIDGMGGLDAAAAALERFRAKAKAAGIPAPHLNAVVWAVPLLPGERGLPDPKAAVQKLGFSSVTSYVWIHHVPVTFPVMSYRACQEQYEAYRARATRDFAPLPYHPNVTMGWDASPRTVATDRFENVGYPFMGTLGGNTPAAFRRALASAKAWLERQGRESPVVTVNAWNEWTEGSYLEPDTKQGLGYLEAVREVFGVSER